MFMSLAGVVFVGLGGILAEFDWRWPFLIYLSAWAALLPAVKFLQEPVRHERKHGDHPDGKAPVRPLAEVRRHGPGRASRAARTSSRRMWR